MLATKKTPLFLAMLAASVCKPYDETPPAAGAPAATAEPQSFSLEYVRELRAENKATRLRLQAAEEAKTTAETAAATASTAAEAKVAAANIAASERLLRSELKAAAIKAGITDPDGLKLADTSKLKLNDAGEIEGLDAFMAEFKTAKPYLFGAAGGNTSPPGGKPPPKNNEPVDAAKLSKEDYAKAKAQLGL